ncbi:MAG TPA: glycosyltransferase family 39 protein [Solirubrobacteraceae bacterium]
MPIAQVGSPPLALPVAGERTATSAGLVGLTVLAVALFAVRLTGQPNLLDNEYRVGACVLDVLQHGNWLCPHDVLGNTDKPPMLTWLAALASWPSGRVTAFTIYLPTAIATVVIAWLVALAGRRLGARAGWLGALAYLLSHVATQQMATARWDGLFALTVAVTAMAAFRAWSAGGGWTGFWLAGAVSTLTKGPLGVLLAAFGLGAVVWERRSGQPSPLRGSHVLGVGLYVVLVFGWFLAAYVRVGPHLIDNMIRAELLGHVVEHQVAYRFWKPIGDFAADFAPWSVLTLLALDRAWRVPAPSDEARRFERFLCCWFLGGLVLFSLSPHNQARLMYPMVPVAAMLAGGQLDRLTATWTTRRLTGVAVVASVVALAVFTDEYHHAIAHKPEVRETVAIQALARTVRAEVGDGFPLAYAVDAPFAVQLSLGTMRPPVTYPEAAELLRGGAAAFVVVGDLEQLRRALGTDSSPLHELAHAADGRTTYLSLVGNRPHLVWDEPIATRVGTLRLTLTGARLGATWDDTVVVTPRYPGGVAIVENGSDAARVVHVGVDGTRPQSRQLSPGASWRVELP